jgi:hypothetical protein
MKRESKLLLLYSHKDPNKPLSGPSQPPYEKVTIKLLTESSSLFRKLLAYNADGKLANTEYQNTLYDPATAGEKKQHANYPMVYILGLLECKIGKVRPGYEQMVRVTEKEVWLSLRTWLVWLEKGKIDMEESVASKLHVKTLGEFLGVSSGFLEQYQQANPRRFLAS